MLTMGLSVVASFGCGGAKPDAVVPNTTAKSAPAPKPQITLPAAPSLRLPGAVLPQTYAITMRMSPTEEKMRGRVDVDVDVKEPSQVIWIHAGDNLDVRSAVMDGSRRGRVERAPSEPQPGGAPRASDFVGLLFDEPITAGAHKLALEYEGKLPARDGRGAYRQEDRGDHYIFTQFEAMDARRAFPCFDEPGNKTPFQITLEVPKAELAFANTRQVNEGKETVDAEGYKKVVFAPSRPLPTYLVAFAVGPFEIVDGGTAGVGKTPIRIIVPKGRSAEAKYAAETTGKVLEQLEKYTGVPYPYDKLDHIAVPQKGGAMENPGLITYGTTTILGRPEDRSIRLERGYIGIASHELGHIWFGDYVTTAWWDDIWLNESFATWISAKITNELHPEWDGLVNKVLSKSGIMSSDALVSARRIRQPIESRHDIANAFDGITYQKGGAVITMMEAYLGPERFQRGVQAYLQRHAHGNATANNFLGDVTHSLVAAPDARSKELAEIFAPTFSTFLDQPGVPLVSAELSCSGAPKVKLSQERYLPTGSAGSSGESSWKIPVCVSFPDGAKTQKSCALMTDRAAEIPLEGAKTCPKWINANADASGYYRVEYKGSSADLATRLVKEKALSVPERLGAFGDALALVRSGQLKEGDVLGLVPGLVAEGNRHLVSMTTGLVWGLSDNLVSDAARPSYHRFVTKMYAARANELGWKPKPNEDDGTRLLRPALVALVAREADPKASAALRAEAKKLTEAFAAAEPGAARAKVIDHDLIGAVLAAGAREADLALWEKLRAAAKSAKDRTERVHLLEAMSAVTDPVLIAKNFDVVLGDDFDLRESLMLVWGSMGDPKNRQMTYDFVKKSYETLASRMPKDWGAGLAGIAGRFCDEEHKKDAESFFKDKASRSTGGPRILTQTLESMSLCITERPARTESVSAFLAKY